MSANPQPPPGAESTLTRQEAVQLLGYYMSLAPPRWQNFQSFVSVFITVDLALLGASLGTLDKFNTWPKNLVLLLGPVAAAVIAQLAKRALRKQERHIRELFVMIGRLEQFLGLDRQFESSPGRFWPGDSSFLPPRWIAARQADATSDQFIDSKRPGGTAKVTFQMFTFVQILSVAAAIGITVSPLL